MHTLGTDSHMQEPYVCPHMDKHRLLASLQPLTSHSLIDAAKVFILSVCLYSVQFICMLWDAPAKTWALNEHPLQFCCQLRQPGQTTWMGGNHRLRIWIRDGSSAWLASPWLLLFSPKWYKLVFARLNLNVCFGNQLNLLDEGYKLLG